MAEKLTRKQIKEYEDAFHAFDTNGDGMISCKELRDFLRSMGQNPTDADVQQIMNRVDTDENEPKTGSGSIEFAEFLTLMTQEQPQQTEEPEVLTEKYRAVFNAFDKDGNGVITVKEFKKAMAKIGTKLSEKKIKKMIKEVDLDGDGCIDYEEFVKMMSS